VTKEKPMTQANPHKIIPARNLFKLLFALAVLIQISVITFSHFNGFYEVADVNNFLARFLQGTFLSLIALVFISYPDLVIINLLDARYEFNKRPVLRIVQQFILTIIIAVTVSTILTLFSHLITGYEEPLNSVLLINALIFSVSNILLMVIFEAWIYFIESTESKVRTRNLENELSQIRFEVLKKQINPHFLFNSLNVLSGLIEKDSEKAQKFIDEFSRIYRYVLETIEQPLVKLGDEITFIRSYMYLQQIRYGESLVYTIDLSSDDLQKYLPPLSLQTVLENVIKHNLISVPQPLTITISSSKDEVVITNNIQPKMKSVSGTGIGQKNLVKRYAMVSDAIPEFHVGKDLYKVHLPLITGEQYETTYY